MFWKNGTNFSCCFIYRAGTWPCVTTVSPAVRAWCLSLTDHMHHSRGWSSTCSSETHLKERQDLSCVFFVWFRWPVISKTQTITCKTFLVSSEESCWEQHWEWTWINKTTEFFGNSLHSFKAQKAAWEHSAGLWVSIHSERNSFVAENWEKHLMEWLCSSASQNFLTQHTHTT